jgi:hypothetical protein
LFFGLLKFAGANAQYFAGYLRDIFERISTQGMRRGQPAPPTLNVNVST